jgi:hypothetical protein
MNDIISALLSALFGTVIGYIAAMRSTRYMEQVAVLTDFKRRLLDYIRKIEKDRGSGNSSLDTIQVCMREMKTDYLLCDSTLNRWPARRLARLWCEFYREDDGSDLLEYWEEDATDVEPKRSKAIARLHAIIAFRIRIYE